MREEVLEQVWGCRMLGTESNIRHPDLPLKE